IVGRLTAEGRTLAEAHADTCWRSDGEMNGHANMATITKDDGRYEATVWAGPTGFAIQVKDFAPVGFRLAPEPRQVVERDIGLERGATVAGKASVPANLQATLTLARLDSGLTVGAKVADGAYRFEHVGEGRHLVTLRAPGWAPVQAELVLPAHAT